MLHGSNTRLADRALTKPRKRNSTVYDGMLLRDHETVLGTQIGGKRVLRALSEDVEVTA